jgi:Uma2 family endonuclease
MASDMRVKVQAAGLYTYPDVLVVRGRMQVEDKHDDTLLNPTVIVEIFSQSSEAYDRGRKFEMYRLIPSLREYLLVNQHEPHIDRFQKKGEEWLLRDVAALNSKLSLPSVGFTIALADVYADVVFVPPVPDPKKPDSRSYF